MADYGSSGGGNSGNVKGTNTQGDVSSDVMSRVSQGIDIIKMAAQGMYYDSQMAKLGLDPNDPKSLQTLQQRYQDLSSTPLEEYITNTPGGNTLSAATRKSVQEQQLKSLLDFYSRKFSAQTGGQQRGPGMEQPINFFK